MSLLRRNWVIVVFLAAVVASFVASNNESHTRDRAQHTQLVRGCVRSSIRVALNASFAHDASVIRRAAGDIRAANHYEADSLGLILTIPAPSGMEGDPALAATEFVKVHGRLVQRVTARATALQIAGCERANR